MPDEFFLKFLENAGWLGISSLLLWIITNRLFKSNDAHLATLAELSSVQKAYIASLSDRVNAIEGGLRDSQERYRICEEDRNRLRVEAAADRKKILCLIEEAVRRDPAAKS